MADQHSGERVEFTLLDRRRRLAGVRLLQDVGLAEPLDLARTGLLWQLEVARPDVARLEYLFEIEDHNGHRTTILDPANPHRVGGAFGDKSVLVFPDYRPPAWLDAPRVAAAEREITVAAPGLDAPVSVTLWVPDGLPDDVPAPLVLVHDGPEFATLGEVTGYLGAAVASGALPPLRAALLDPGDRNDWYAANPAYAQAICQDVLPVLDRAAPASCRIGVGASLGALAMLHLHRHCPGLLDAMLLQSGSFFTPELDGQESTFGGFAAVTGFVAEVAAADSDPAPVPVVLTCGTVEENLANNRAMTTHLRRLGYPAELAVVRDAHNFTAWRDALDPHLARLVRDAARAS